MGQTLTNSVSKLFKEEEKKVLVLGIDGAGKTSFLYYTCEQEPITTYNMSLHIPDTAKWKNLRIVSWDIGGGRQQQFWKKTYLPNTNGIIFMVDSKDRQSMEIIRDEFVSLLKEDELKGVPLLVLANKQDLEGIMSLDEITKLLELNEIQGRKWAIQGCSVVKRLGTVEALQWIQSQI